MQNTLRVAIAIVSILLTLTAWAQETREATCEPAEVKVVRDRVELRCASDMRDGGENVSLYAVPAADAEFANRFLNAASSALVGGRLLLVQFQGKSLMPGELSPSCGKGCRLVVAISIR